MLRSGMHPLLGRLRGRMVGTGCAANTPRQSRPSIFPGARFSILLPGLSTTAATSIELVDCLGVIC